MGMEAEKAKESCRLFGSVLAPILSEQMRIAGGLECRFAAGDSGTAETAFEADKRVAVSLRFEGALSGNCTLACSAGDGARLAVESADAASLLARAAQAACEPFAAALFAHYGSVRVHPVEDPAGIEDGQPVAWLSSPGPSEGETEIRIAIYADGELERGLLRLARVAAAAEASGITSGNLGLVMDVELNVTLRFGQRQLSLREVMDLTSGSVVELDREVDEPVELMLDGRVIARGEAVIVDGNYGVRVTEVLQPMVL